MKMVIQLVLGSCMIAVSVMVQGACVALAATALGRLGQWVTADFMNVRLMILVAGLTLWMLGGLTVTVWLWAGLMVHLGVFDTLEVALYFSTVAFTTLGFGDIVLEPDWRLMSGLMATNGLILFSLSTAFLFEAIRQINNGQARARSGGRKRSEP